MPAVRYYLCRWCDEAGTTEVNDPCWLCLPRHIEWMRANNDCIELGYN